MSQESEACLKEAVSAYELANINIQRALTHVDVTLNGLMKVVFARIFAATVVLRCRTRSVPAVIGGYRLVC